MKYIDLMVQEHVLIKRMLKVVRAYCQRIIDGKKTDYSDFLLIADFIRNYADLHHHGKEEKMLFKAMVEELGPLADKVITRGMLVEHDLGRFYASEMVAAAELLTGRQADARLDLVANAMAYVNLLHRHIDKEDNAVFKFAAGNLQADTHARLAGECDRYEEAAEKAGVQSRYLNLLEDLESRV